VVLTRSSRATLPALLVPDELSWTLWGQDPALGGLAPASAEEARVLLAPARVPSPLVAALREEWQRAGGGARVEARDAPVAGGVALAEALEIGGGHAHGGGHDEHAGHGGHGGHAGHDEHAGHGGHGGHDEHAGHGGHDHHAMMAIVGEPSADGLVMEPIAFTLGPLSGVLPGGLAVDVELDGDVVSACTVRALLRAGPAEHGQLAPPDPLAPVTWTTALRVAEELERGDVAEPAVQWLRLAAVEVERAVSHLAWLRSLGRLLGWGELVRVAQEALGPLLALHRPRAPRDSQDGAPSLSPHTADAPLAEARRAAERVVRLVAGRRFAGRTLDRGRLAGHPGLVGPNARAAGDVEDRRRADALYAALGFAAAEHGDGDVRARALVRVFEVREALRLAAEALARADVAAPDAQGVPAFADQDGVAVEGPRGPVRIRRPANAHHPDLEAPGSAAALEAAGRAAVGQEWASALVTLASFDLSPWRVGT